MTSSIARMNCFLHGIEDFQIVRDSRDDFPTPPWATRGLIEYVLY
jgi:type I restriction-modification system DNA methylase subunit